MVRQRAGEAIVALSDKPIDQLPTAKVALTNEAERYYGHKVRLPDPNAVVVWQWKDKRLTGQTMPPSQAEEYYGLKFARQALDLDPAYEPAQVLFVSLALEKAYERTGLQRPLEQGAPAVKELLKTINPDLLDKALDRALADHRLAVILGVVRALGELGDIRALRPQTLREPALARALYYGDRRVQLAAAEAILRIPTKTGTPYSARVVEILRRALAADAAPRALVADVNLDRAHELAHAIQDTGFDAVVRATGREVLLRLREAADIDVLLIDAGIPDSPMPHLLAQLRADVDFGLLPIIITIPADASGASPADFERRMERLAEPYRNVWVMTRTLDPSLIKQTLNARLTDALGNPLTKEERAANALTAMTWLRRLAVGEIPGYDVRPAEKAILEAMRSSELASLAIEAAGRLPGGKPQRAIADAVLTSSTPALQAAAALELARHIRQHDLALPVEYLRGIEALYGSTTDAKLRTNLALLLGSFRPSPELTGTRLQRYVPQPQPKAPATKEK
jgi:CheY-like chemotaxis protein